MKGYLRLLLLLPYISFAQQYVWQQKASIPSLGRHAPIGFAINGAAYFGMGQDNLYSGYNDLWLYDTATDIWSQKASMPAAGRVGAGCFSIGANGFVCCGWTNTQNATQLNDTWKYDASLNLWTQVASFPASGRYTPSVFVIGTNAYVGMGYAPFYNDFYEYNSVNDVWTQKASYPYALQTCATFSYNSKGYCLGGGGTGSVLQNEVYEYDPILNSWTQKNNFPSVTAGAFSFVLNNTPYIGMGTTQITPSIVNTTNVYSYDSSLDIWTLISVFPSLARSSSSGLTIGSNAYIFGGNDQTSGTITPIGELWKFSLSPNGLNEYDKNNVSIFIENHTKELCVKHNLTKKAMLQVYDITGKRLAIFQLQTKSESFFLNEQVFKNGVYLFSFFYENNLQIISGKFVLN